MKLCKQSLTTRDLDWWTADLEICSHFLAARNRRLGNEIARYKTQSLRQQSLSIRKTTKSKTTKTETKKKNPKKHQRRNYPEWKACQTVRQKKIKGSMLMDDDERLGNEKRKWNFPWHVTFISLCRLPNLLAALCRNAWVYKCIIALSHSDVLFHLFPLRRFSTNKKVLLLVYRYNKESSTIKTKQSKYVSKWLWNDWWSAGDLIERKSSSLRH